MIALTSFDETNFLSLCLFGKRFFFSNSLNLILTFSASPTSGLEPVIIVTVIEDGTFSWIMALKVQRLKRRKGMFNEDERKGVT